MAEQEQQKEVAAASQSKVEQIISQGKDLGRQIYNWEKVAQAQYTQTTEAIREQSIQGIQKVEEIGRVGVQVAQNTMVRPCFIQRFQQTNIHDSVCPEVKKIRLEKQKISEEYMKEIIRSDNFWYRQKLVSCSSFGVLAASYLMNSRGRFRYSLRNAGIFYFAASYLVCPENLNPFAMKRQV